MGKMGIVGKMGKMGMVGMMGILGILGILGPVGAVGASAYRHCPSERQSSVVLCQAEAVVWEEAAACDVAAGAVGS